MFLYILNMVYIMKNLLARITFSILLLIALGFWIIGTYLIPTAPIASVFLCIIAIGGAYTSYKILLRK